MASDGVSVCRTRDDSNRLLKGGDISKLKKWIKRQGVSTIRLYPPYPPIVKPTFGTDGKNHKIYWPPNSSSGIGGWCGHTAHFQPYNARVLVPLHSRSLQQRRSGHLIGPNCTFRPPQPQHRRNRIPARGHTIASFDLWQVSALVASWRS